MGMPQWAGRYHSGARFYDVLSGERWMYRSGRLRGIEALKLKPGGRVLDIGCGTGLNMPPVLELIGPNGQFVGVDRSSAMLALARARIARHGWRNVSVIDGDAAQLGGLVAEVEGFDAAIFTYALSIIDEWRESFDQAVALLRPGGRIAVVDMALPVGRWQVAWPLARLACLTGGADPYRWPWTRVLARTDSVTYEVIRGGHVHIAAGTRRAPEGPAE